MLILPGNMFRIIFHSTLSYHHVKYEMHTLCQTAVQGVQVLGSQPIVVPYLEMLLVLVISWLIAARLVMITKEQKMFALFKKLGPLRFFSVLGDNAFEFLVICQKRLHNLVLKQFHMIDYTIYQMNGTTKQWW